MAGAYLALAVLLGTGCASLADRIVHPGRDAPFAPEEAAAMATALGAREHRVPLPNGVTLRVLHLPAMDRAFTAHYTPTPKGARFGMQARLAAQAEPVKSRGTVLLLHGWGMDATSMLPWAAALADRGWEGWLVDLRGHGGSSDAPAGYGTREAADVAALVAALERDGRLEPPVTLLGVSYGATTALFSEPALRGRVRAIVALAPFSNAGQAVRELVAGSLDDTGGSLHARALRRVARWRYDDPDRIDAAIAMASRTLGLEIDAVDLLPVVAGTDTCTLLLHGGNDDLVPIAHSRRIAAGADVVQLIELASEDHISLPLRVDWLAAPVADWLDAAVADASGEAHGAACPGFPLPADPAIPAE